MEEDKLNSPNKKGMKTLFPDQILEGDQNNNITFHQGN